MNEWDTPGMDRLRPKGGEKVFGEETVTFDEIQELRGKVAYLSGYGTLHYMVTPSDPDYKYRVKLDELVRDLQETMDRIFPIGGKHDDSHDS